MVATKTIAGQGADEADRREVEHAKGSPTALPGSAPRRCWAGFPIRVIMPPRIAANESGISDNDTARLAFLAASMVYGH